MKDESCEEDSVGDSKDCNKVVPQKEEKVNRQINQANIAEEKVSSDTGKGFDKKNDKAGGENDISNQNKILNTKNSLKKYKKLAFLVLVVLIIGLLGLVYARYFNRRNNEPVNGAYEWKDMENSESVLLTKDVHQFD